MDNNEFDNNENRQDDDIFAEETVNDTQEPDGDQDRPDQSDRTQDNGQQNRSTVNPGQWQNYRRSQEQGYDQGPRFYGGQNPYGQYGYQNNPYQNYNGYYRPDNSKGFGIASLVLGIISLLCFCSFLNIVPAVLAIVFGAISLSKKKDNAFAIAGIVCAAVSIALLIITGILFAANTSLMNAFRDYVEHYNNNGFNYYFR